MYIWTQMTSRKYFLRGSPLSIRIHKESASPPPSSVMVCSVGLASERAAARQLRVAGSWDGRGAGAAQGPETPATSSCRGGAGRRRTRARGGVGTSSRDSNRLTVMFARACASGRSCVVRKAVLAITILGLLGGCSPRPQEVEDTSARSRPPMPELIAPAALAEPGSVSLDRRGPLSPSDDTGAQVEMLDRVGKDVAAYAAKIGISSEYADYCRLKLSMETNAQPADGLIPFGVNYNELQSWERLNSVIRERERYERVYQILCLADAKNALIRAASSD